MSLSLPAMVLLATACGLGSPPPSPSGTPRPMVISSTNTPVAATSAAGQAVIGPSISSKLAQPSAVALQTPTASGNQVRIQDFGFTPSAIAVTTGTQLTWTNGGPSNHTVTANDGSFDSGTILRNASFTFTFTKPGTFAYHCTFHITMTGTVTVS